MHLLTNRKPLAIGAGVALPPGTYLVEDMDAAQMIAMAGGRELELAHWQSQQSILPLSDFNGKTITIVRPGRYGDLILLTPCLREIKRRWPKCVLQVATQPHYREAIMGLPYIDNYLPYPLSKDDMELAGCILTLEVLTSLFKREGELHMTDLFAERLGLGEFEDKHPDFFLTLDERTWAHEKYPRLDGHRRVAIQVKSSTPSRDYPPVKMGEVVRRLHGRGWDCVFLGLPNQIEGTSKERLTNCANDKLTFRQSAAVLATADVFFGPDSALIHVAGALGTPAVGVFSVVPWNLRTTYCPTTFVIQSKKGCDLAPCFHAPFNAMGFPAKGPCNKARNCVALAAIEPHEVVGRIEQCVAKD